MSIMRDINELRNKIDERKPETLKTPQTHIADADGSLASVTAQFNALLDALEAAGILSTS